MPNHIDVTLSVLGKDQRLVEFVRTAKGKRKPTGDRPSFPDGRINHNYHPNPPDSVFEFDRLVPLPESFSQFSYDEHGYDLEVKTWGIKWGAYQHKPPKFEEGCATYQFRCAWEAPRTFLQKVSTLWSDVWLVVSYGGEGPVRGRFALHDGTYLVNIADDEGCEYDETMSEEAWDTFITAWTDAYLNTHEAFTKDFPFTYILGETNEQAEPQGCIETYRETP